jgi:hypothetical protein
MTGGFRTLKRTIGLIVVVLMLVAGASLDVMAQRGRGHGRHDNDRHDNGRHRGWTRGRHRGWEHSRSRHVRDDQWRRWRRREARRDRRDDRRDDRRWRRLRRHRSGNDGWQRREGGLYERRIRAARYARARRGY